MKTTYSSVASGYSTFGFVRASRLRPLLKPSYRLFLSMLLAVASIIAAPRVHSAELLQNGGFSSGLDHWSLPIPLVKKNWNPLVSGSVQLHPPGSFLGYIDDVIYQPLNVPGVSGKTVTASLKLRKSFGDDPLKTIAVFLEYVTTGGTVERVLAFEASNALVTDVADEWTPFQQDVSFPVNARKLTKFIIAKQNWGDFIADDASLSSTELVAGAVPHIAAVSGSGQYGAPMTLTGTDLGSPPRPSDPQWLLHRSHSAHLDGHLY